MPPPAWNAPGPLRIPTEHSVSSGGIESETPRDPVTMMELQPSLPCSPGATRKSRSRAAFTHRSNSLKESKVLLVTEARRSDSVLHPDLFQYHNHFEFLGLLGKTRTSEVFRVRHRATGELFAVKRSRRRFRSKMQRERCLREVRAVASLPTHPNLVSQYRAWQEGGHFYIQMDLCQGGSLLESVQRVHAVGFRLTDDQLWQVVLDVASGLAFLHASNVLHLDIKPENIYRSAEGVWRIGDFGLAVANESGDWEEGDGNYVAPELLRGLDPAPTADIFSLGATLYECATGRKLPRGAESPSAEPARSALDGRAPALVRVIESMLDADLARRPTAAEIVQLVLASSDAVLRPTPSPAASLSPPRFLRAPSFGAAASSAATPHAACFPLGAARGGALDDECTSPARPVADAPEPLGFSFSPAPGSTFTRARGGLQRWAPSLSPLPTESGCALEGAAQRAPDVQLTPRIGTTPSAMSGASTPSEATARGKPTTPLSTSMGSALPTGGPAPSANAVTPSPFSEAAQTPRRVAQPQAQTPAQLHEAPPSSAGPRRPSLPSLVLPGSAGQSRSAPSSGTADSSGSFRLRRRDLLSPDSDWANGADSASDSEAFSGSCGTMSELEFVDTMPTDAAGTGHAAMLTPGSVAGTQRRVLPARSSLAWDLYASPELLVALGPNCTTSPDGQEGGPQQRAFSLRRFPTLDTLGSMTSAIQGAPAGGLKESGEGSWTAQSSMENTAAARSLGSRRTLMHSLSCDAPACGTGDSRSVASSPRGGKEGVQDLQW